MAINQEMPEDVLTEILSRLPVKSLLRFKPVSKHWCSLIQNPSFISIHSNRSPKNDSLLVKRLLGRPSKLTLSLVSNETPIHNIDIPFSCPLDIDLDLVGSSNGVVCLANSLQILLCNPAMREFRKLPQPRYWTRPTSHLGFAFDPQTNDFKVLRVAAVYKLDHGSMKSTRVGEKVEIYNNKRMGLWREIIAVVPKDIQSGSRLNRLTWLDGVFYWVAKDPDGRSKIIAFHMFDELFEQVFLPEDIRIIDMSSLCVMRDSLALVAFKYCSLLLDIWLRDGKGVKDLWVKRYSIGLTLGRYDALGFRQNGELLRLRDNKDCRLVSYNLDTQKIEEYHDVYNDPRSTDFQVLSYAESLVSVK